MLDFKMELATEAKVAKVEKVKFAGRFLIFADLPTPLPAFYRVNAKLDDKVVATSDGLILPIWLPQTRVGWEWWPPHPSVGVRIPFGEYWGEIKLPGTGKYKMYAQAFATPLRKEPPLAESEEIDLEFTQIVIGPGTPLIVKFPVTMTEGLEMDYTVEAIFYEGSFMPKHGTEISRYEKLVHFVPGKKTDILFDDKAVSGTIDRRDISIGIFKDTAKKNRIVSKEWDDVYFVKG